MTDGDQFKALEARFTTALRRIKTGVDALQQSDPSPALTAQVAEMKERIAGQSAQLQALDSQIQDLRAANDKLREVNADLRAAMKAGFTAELNDKAAEAEIAALTAQRAADAVEIDAILAELAPLVKDV